MFYGVGADEATAAPTTIDETVIEAEPEAPPATEYETLYQSRLYTAIEMAGAVIGTYHGYKRNNSVGWALVWGVLGGMVPIFTIPIALAQGLGKKKGQ